MYLVVALLTSSLVVYLLTASLVEILLAAPFVVTILTKPFVVVILAVWIVVGTAGPPVALAIINPRVGVVAMHLIYVSLRRPFRIRFVWICDVVVGAIVCVIEGCARQIASLRAVVVGIWPCVVIERISLE